MSENVKRKLEEYEQQIERYQTEIIKLRLELHNKSDCVEIDPILFSVLIGLIVFFTVLIL